MGSYPRDFLEYVGYSEDLIQKILFSRKYRQSFNEVLDTITPMQRATLMEYFKKQKSIDDISESVKRSVSTIYRHIEETKLLFQDPKVYRFIKNGEKNFAEYQIVVPDRNYEQERELENMSVFKSKTLWLEDLDITYTATNFLHTLGLYTAQEVSRISADEFVLYKQVSRGIYKEIADIVSRCGVTYPEYQAIHDRFFKRTSWRRSSHTIIGQSSEKI